MWNWQRFVYDSYCIYDCQVENLINIKKDMFVLQSLQVYITNLDTSVGVIMMEKDPPHNLETCIGTILSCRNKVDIDELGTVRFSALILTLRSARCWTANTRAKSPCSRTAAIRTSSSASLRAFLPTSTWRTR